MQKKTIVFSALLFLMGITLTHAQIYFKKYAGGLKKPIAVENCGDIRMFVIEQEGRIKLINENGVLQTQSFLDITAKINSIGGELGLLGLAFSPDYKTDNSFYLYYTNTDAITKSVIARYKTSTNPFIADTTEQIILKFAQPFPNHNGGRLKFGKDGYLYIASGDGGDGGDPYNNAQNKNSLLGKILRIDVKTSDTSYIIPPDNPFVNDTAVKKEIWHYGLRNPWGFSFDRLTNDMWIGDVGQTAYEEVDKVSAGKGGLNFGWRCREGAHNYDLSLCTPQLQFTEPVFDYIRDSGTCVIGGFVYRGALFPSLYGNYIFADYGARKIYSLTIDSPYVKTVLAHSFTVQASSFGEDIYGELYFTSMPDSSVYHIVDTTACRPVSIAFNKPDSMYYCGDSLLLTFLPYNPSLTYTWYKNNAVIENYNPEKNIFYAKSPGNYQVKVSRSDSCFTSSAILKISYCTPDDLVLIPNPAKDNITMVFNSDVQQEMDFVFFDMKGQVVKHFEANTANGYNEIKVSLAGFAKGVYTVRATSANNNFKKKFVVM